MGQLLLESFKGPARPQAASELEEEVENLTKKTRGPRPNYFTSLADHKGAPANGRICDGAQRRLVCLCPRPQISHFQVSIAMGRSAAPLQLRLQPAQHRYRNNPMLTPSTCAPGTIQPNAYQVPVHIEYEITMRETREQYTIFFRDL